MKFREHQTLTPYARFIRAVEMPRPVLEVLFNPDFQILAPHCKTYIPPPPAHFQFSKPILFQDRTKQRQKDEV